MKKSITRTPLSESDAYEIYVHIANDDIDAAEAYFDELFDVFDKLLDHPKLGVGIEQASGELHGLRYIPVSSKFRKYIVFYLPTEDGVHIIRIIHSARDIETLLFDRFE